MQVKVTYTSELEDVPEEVANILEAVASESSKFQQILQDLQKDLVAKEISVAKPRLKLAMEKLQKMFARITDCHVILEGYEKVKTQPQQAQQQPAQTTQTEQVNPLNS